jgi:hypothetical protein
MNGVGVGTERDDKHKAFLGALTVLFDLVPTSLISHLLSLIRKYPTPYSLYVKFGC